MPPQSADTRAANGALLERSRELSTLGAFLDDAKETSRGRFVFLAGEAGIGKTALLRELCAYCRRGTRVLWGGCDPMVTPQPLAPLLDIAEAVGGETAALVTAGAKPHPIAAALLRDLAAPAPTVLVVEDLHWADEATLDILGLLARRIGDKPVLVLASYRDDSLDRRGPLRVLLGELATTPDVTRMPLAPLSREAVATLAAPHGVDADTLYEATDGNAFFVTEVLASAQEEIPATVRDAVLARTARLSPGARSLLDAAAVLVPPVEIAILHALLPQTRAANSRSASRQACSLPRAAQLPTVTNCRVWRSSSHSRRICESRSTARRCRLSRTDPAVAPRRRAWPITPRRRATRTRFSASRRQRRAPPPRSAPIARRPRSTIVRCASLMWPRSECERNCWTARPPSSP